jgi:predicted O-methyltransferase YrrM
MFWRVRDSAREKLQRAIVEVVGAELQPARDDLQEILAEVTRAREELRAAEARLRESVAEERAVLSKAIVDLEWRQRRDLYFAAEVRCAAESEAFILERMPKVPSFPHPWDTLRFGLRTLAVDGLVLEFGVATGATMRIIREELPDRPAYGFDVFTGLPEDWRTGFPAGAFAQQELPDAGGAELVVGLFEDTLPGFMAEHPGPVAFLHLDADLYSAAVTVLEHVGPRLVEGSVIVFDEYFNYPGWQDGEHKAWEEYVARTGLEYRYEGYTYDHEQLVVTVTRAARPAAAAADAVRANGVAAVR